MAIEDSPTGATSAAAAGCQVLVVPNHVAVPPGERRTFRDSLVGITPPYLENRCRIETSRAGDLPVAAHLTPRSMFREESGPDQRGPPEAMLR